MLPLHEPFCHCFRASCFTCLYCSTSAFSWAKSSAEVDCGGRISVAVRNRIGAQAFSRIQVTGTRCCVGSSRVLSQ